MVTNVDKCTATLICCSLQTVADIQVALPYVVAQFPSRYLGVSLSLSWLHRVEEQPLVDSIAARIPTWKVGLLTHSGCILLTKVTLLAILVHICISCCLLSWALGQIDKRRAFLWIGSSEAAEASVRSLGHRCAGQPLSVAWGSWTYSSSD